jgi:hypothetical protein
VETLVREPDETSLLPYIFLVNTTATSVTTIAPTTTAASRTVSLNGSDPVETDVVEEVVDVELCDAVDETEVCVDREDSDVVVELIWVELEPLVELVEMDVLVELVVVVLVVMLFVVTVPFHRGGFWVSSIRGALGVWLKSNSLAKLFELESRVPSGGMPNWASMYARKEPYSYVL